MSEHTRSFIVHEPGSLADCKALIKARLLLLPVHRQKVFVANLTCVGTALLKDAFDEEFTRRFVDLALGYDFKITLEPTETPPTLG